MALPTFTDLLGEIRSPSLLHTSFLANPNPYPTGPIDTGGGQSPDPTGPVYSGGGTAPGVITNAASGTFGCSSFSLWNPFCWGQIGSQAQACVGDFLLRIGLFILGFVLIAGAIYLYKGSGVLAIPTKIARGAVKAGTGAVKAIAQSNE